MVNDHAATEDIIQEAFLKVVQKIPAVENEAQLKGWIKVVVRNTTYNYIRKNKKNRNLIDADCVFIDDDPSFAIAAETIEAEVEMKVMSEAIGKYLQDLKPEYRVLIEMRWKQELSYKEIAGELDLSEETVKYKLHRARESIKKRFVKEWGETNE